MTVPPMILHLRVASSQWRPFRLWLPLFLLWPLAFALGLLALLLMIGTDLVLLLLGRRYHHYTALLVRSLATIGETRGMVIRVHNEETAVDVAVR